MLLRAHQSVNYTLTNAASGTQQTESSHSVPCLSDGHGSQSDGTDFDASGGRQDAVPPRSETGSGAAWKGPSSGISIFGAVGGKRMSEPVVKRRETGQLPTSILMLRRLVEVEVWLSMPPRECGYLH